MEKARLGIDLAWISKNYTAKPSIYYLRVTWASV